MKPTPAQETAQHRIHELLSELADQVGPWGDGAAEDELEPEDQPQGQVFLSEWAAVLYWVDQEGDGFSTRITSANLPAHHRAGLLHEGLWRFDD